MPTFTIPFVGPFNRRLGGGTTVDQRFINCLFTEAPSKALGKNKIYAEKRGGLSSSTTPSNVKGGGVFFSPSSNKVISIFEPGTGSNIFDGTTNIGATTGVVVIHISEAIFNGITYILFTTSGQTAFFYPVGSATSFTGTTHTNTTVDGIGTTLGLYVGQPVSKVDFQAGTRIASIDSGTQITITLAATGSSSGTVTVTPLAKIIDSDFPTDITGPLVEMDGYLFIGTVSGRVYNSDLNSASSWGAANFITANISTDPGIGAFKYKNRIGFFGTNSLEFFHNAGNPSGSILSSDAASAIGIGCLGGGTGGYPANFFAKQDSVYWIGQDAMLYTLSDGANKLTNPGIILNNSSPGTTAMFFYRGLKVISVYDGGSFTYWYYPDYDIFSQVTHSVFTQIWISSDSNTGGVAQTYITAAGDANGKVFRMDNSTSTFQDNGSAFTMTIQTEPKVPNKGSGFTIPYIDLLADNQSSGSTTLEISRDDYATWETIGTFDLTKTKKRIHRCGFCRSSAAFRLTDSGNNAWRGQALEVFYEPCSR